MRKSVITRMYFLLSPRITLRDQEQKEFTEKLYITTLQIEFQIAEIKYHQQ